MDRTRWTIVIGWIIVCLAVIGFFASLEATDVTKTILMVGWGFVGIWVPIVIYTNRNTHPFELFILFFSEMWERFSYYGMRALLTLYMVNVLFSDMVQQEADTRALGVYGAYTSMVYLFPIVGGLIADKIFGFRKAIVLGGTLMMLGHFSLALEGMAFEGNMGLFYVSLALIIVGNGYFKPNISSFLGVFYDRDDSRKDGAFTIFYMGINIGAFLSTLTCGYVGEKISWHYGFGLAGIGMGLGLIVFLWYSKFFGPKGQPPDREDASRPIFAGLSKNRLVYIGSVLMIPVVAAFLNINNVLSVILGVASLAVIGYLILQGILLQRKEAVAASSAEASVPGGLVPDGDAASHPGYTEEENPKASGQRLWVIGVLFVFHAVFWALFEQAGGSLTLFADRYVDRSVGGSIIPASVMQSFNPFYIIVLAPVFSWIWINLNKARIEPSTPMKFVLGLAQLALGFLVIVLAARAVGEGGQVPLIFLALMYLLHTTGELSLSPIGLSMITKLSPPKIVGFVMGAWFLSIALGNNLAGLIGQIAAGGQEGEALDSMAAYADTYMNIGVYFVAAAAAVLLLMTPILRRWMHGIH